ncbi:MAG: DNA repair protein RecN [Firmicutes bacterium]|nr:DNA repair protein RecN [Bacillota bacterium]
MVEKLKINNFALIKSLEIDFSNGFNVLIGETGAGKSIILSALNFVLGGKADKAIIRSGEEVAKVSAVFSCDSVKLNNLFEQFGIEKSDELLITRSYNTQGKNDVRINGEMATVGMLKEFGALLVDSYNQNEQVEMTKTKNHIRILDSYKPQTINVFKSKLMPLIEEINSIDAEIKKLGGNGENRARRIDILNYQIQEIEDAALKEGEEEELSDTLARISQSEKVLNAISELENVLSGEDYSLISSLSAAKNKMIGLASIDEQLADISDRLSSSVIELEDISESLSSIYEKFSFDENKINSLIARRDEIDGLKHKYGKDYSEIMQYLMSSKQELDLLSNAEEKLFELSNKRAEIKGQIFELSKKLSNQRKENAKEIEKLLENGLKEVGIKNSKFKICFANEPVFDEFETFSEEGFDVVEFMFSANLGEELKPLSKTISGGEMSRFMLVLKNILAETGGAQTIVFDEIDSGISGQIADEVALKIESLSKNYQIICITHLPQVAAKGDNFIHVFKETVDGRTESKCEILTDEQIIKQIAITASGNVTEASIQYAKELRAGKK